MDAIARGGMAVPGRPAVVEDGARNYVSVTLSRGLISLLAEAGRVEEWQGRLAQAGIDRMARLAGQEAATSEVQAAVEAQPGLRPAKDAREREIMTDIHMAWVAAEEVVERAAETRAESEAMNTSRTGPPPERLALQRVVVTRYGELRASEPLGVGDSSQKSGVVEQNDPKEMLLAEITCTEVRMADILGTSVDATDMVMILKNTQEALLPKLPDAHGERIRVESNIWLFLATKHTNMQWLRGLTPDNFDRFTDYILGELVGGLQAPAPGRLGGEGAMDVYVPWRFVLSDERDVRKRVLQKTKEDGAARNAGRKATDGAGTKMRICHPTKDGPKRTRPEGVGDGR